MLSSSSLDSAAWRWRSNDPLNYVITQRAAVPVTRLRQYIAQLLSSERPASTPGERDGVLKRDSFLLDLITTFTILLIDRNDNAPTFNSSEYRVLITELAQVGFALPLFIQAEDKDEVGGPDATGERAAPTSPDPLTRSNAEEPQCDQRALIQVPCRVISAVALPEMTTTTTTTTRRRRRRDAIDPPPVTPRQRSSGGVSSARPGLLGGDVIVTSSVCRCVRGSTSRREALRGQRSIEHLTASGGHTGVNSMFQVFLRGNHSEYFTISPTAVQGRADIRVRVALPLDYENIRSYSFSLYANESMSDHVGFARVFIELVNDNDNRPIFSRPLYNISLPEDSRAGSSLLRVLATDRDAGIFGVVRYYFSDEPDQFSLDEETGWVILRAALDYELMRRFTLTVLARDGGGEETTGRIRINVLDVNDNAPLFQKEAYAGSLRENEQAVQAVARVRATDEDSPPNNLLTYTITSASAFPDYFSILMVEGYAVISVTRPLDYEQVPRGVVRLTVTATDGGNPALNSTVPVTVEDENDNPPEFSRQSYIVKIPENIIAGESVPGSPPGDVFWCRTNAALKHSGATVLLVNATDLDASREYGQASLIYSLEGSSQFRLNSRSGEVTTTALLDRELKSEYILIVRAVDGGVGPQQKTGIATVNITILDINDNAPLWRDEPYRTNVVEMSPMDTDVISVSTRPGEGRRSSGGSTSWDISRVNLVLVPWSWSPGPRPGPLVLSPGPGPLVLVLVPWSCPLVLVLVPWSCPLVLVPWSSSWSPGPGPLVLFLVPWSWSPGPGPGPLVPVLFLVPWSWSPGPGPGPLVPVLFLVHVLLLIAS
ncbi:Cadherin-23 [Liparis tanakae]|uniref:Cadherin-23 n=1 Tax=Liparis tanakae TaxID=230148 RepID=A0A4Z2F3Q5_9TELE|nr:Cadherin-23 [Liparis tanakae]